MNYDKCLWYRCRQCAAVFANASHAGGELMHKRVVSAAQDGAESPWMFWVHACGHDRLGLAELIGSGPIPATAPQIDPEPSNTSN